MNRVKHLAVIFLIFVMCFGMCVPVFADDTADYTFDLQSTVQSVYAGGICTVSYWHPVGYPNVWVAFSSYGGGYSDGAALYIMYYNDDTTFACGSTGITFSQEAYIVKTTSIAEMEDILFNGAIPDCTFTTSGGPGWSNSIIYQDTDPAMRQNGNPQSLEAYYYNWYYEQNGVYPVGITIRMEYICNGEIIETQATETVAGSSVLLQDIIQEPEGYVWDTINIAGTEYVKADSFVFTEDTDITIIMTATTSSEDSSGIIAKLQELWDLLKVIAYPNPNYEFMADINNKLASKLEDNGFYTSLCRIQKELTSIYNQDYSDPAGFHEINPAKLTLRRPVIATDDGGSYRYSDIDWGLNDVSVLGDMKWFFGTHYNTGKAGGFINVDGSPAVKHYSDLLISAFLWVGFAFMLWQRLPDILSGDFATMTATGADIVNTSVAGSRTIDDMYRTTKVDMATGEVLSDTMTTKRRVKK